MSSASQHASPSLARDRRFSLPVALDDADGADFDPQRVAAQLRDQVRTGRPRRPRGCRHHSRAAAGWPRRGSPPARRASTRPWFSKQSQARRALSLSGTSPCSHRKSTNAPASSVSSSADLAVGAGADDMDRTRVLPQLFADGAEIDEARRPARARPRRRGAGRGCRWSSSGPACCPCKAVGVYSRGELPRSKPGSGTPPRSPPSSTRPARMPPASAWASSTSAQGRTQAQPAARAWTMVVRGAQHVDHDRHAARQPLRRRQLRQQMDLRLPCPPP